MPAAPITFAQGMARLSAARKAKAAQQAEKAKEAAMDRHNDAILQRTKVDRAYAINFAGRHKKVIQMYEPPAELAAIIAAADAARITPPASPPSSHRRAVPKSSAAMKAMRKDAAQHSLAIASALRPVAPKAIQKKVRNVPMKHNNRFPLLFARPEARLAFFKRVYAGGVYHPEEDVCRCPICRKK